MGSRTPDLDAFIEDGFVCIRGAFPRDVADECRHLLWLEIGASPDDASTWTQPVVRVFDMIQPPFAEAANTPVLRDAFDALVGPDRWQPRPGIGGIPIDGTPRFMGQPPLHLAEGNTFDLDGPSPVERAIRLGLDRPHRSRRRYT